MRRISLLIALLMVVSAIAPALAQDEVTLVIWGEPGTVSCINDPEQEDDACIYARFVNDNWHEANPGIMLKWEDHGWDEELRQNLTLAILGGTAPDITVGETFMPSMVAAGNFAEPMLSQETLDNLVPGTVAAVTDADGTVYGVAAFSAVFALEVNADVVRAAGLDPDTLDLSTWDKVAETAAAITEAGGGEYYGVSILAPTPWPAAALFRIAPYVYQSGADFCEMPACEVPTLNDPKAVPAYEWFRELYQYADQALAFNGDEGFVFTQLFEGKSAMQTAGSWHPKWAKDTGCEDCRYLPLPIPEGGQGANVVVGNAIYSILESSEHVEEASMFLEFLVNDAVQNTSFWSTGRMPSTYSSLDILTTIAGGDTELVPPFYEDVFGKDPADAPADAAVFDAYINELKFGDVRILPPWAEEGAALNQIWNDMFAEILITDTPVQDILDTYQAQAEEIVSK